jgi:hypothetical protein
MFIWHGVCPCFSHITFLNFGRWLTSWVLPRPNMSWVVKPTKFEGMANSFLFLHAFWTYFHVSLIISMALLVISALSRSCWLWSHFQFPHQACCMFSLNSKLECGDHPSWSINRMVIFGVGEHNCDITACKWPGTLSGRRILRLNFSHSM